MSFFLLTAVLFLFKGSKYCFILYFVLSLRYLLISFLYFLIWFK